jgi:hypothetical protein
MRKAQKKMLLKCYQITFDFKFGIKACPGRLKSLSQRQDQIGISFAETVVDANIAA